LCWSVTVIELIDPHLVWSVGFWLSVSATASLITLARPLASLLPGPPRVAQALAVAVAAQVGAAVPSLLVFGSLAPLSIPANLAALPAAGAVMLIGIPSGLAVAVVPLPPAVQRLVMLPACIACRWVLDVARLAAALSPHGWGSVAVWAGQLIVLLALVMVRRLRFRRAILNG
jgi:competence protein ComEC